MSIQGIQLDEQYVNTFNELEYNNLLYAAT